MVVSHRGYRSRVCFDILVDKIKELPPVPLVPPAHTIADKHEGFMSIADFYPS
jgi:hypothetical protein